MNSLKAHYEDRLNELSTHPSKSNEANSSDVVIEKIKALKSSLVGGECANDVQLKEKRKRKKMAAEHRRSALTKALNNVETVEVRDILQGHYTDIQHELKVKTDALKSETKKVRSTN